MKRLSLTLLAAASLSLAAAASLHAQMILNGSFESPALKAGSSAYGSGANWTASNNGYPYVVTNGGGGTTPYGTQYEQLTANVTDTQMVSGLTLGTNYTLSLVASAYSAKATQLTIAISGGATASQSFAVPARAGGISNAPFPFVTYSLAFTPTTSTAVTVTLSDSAAGTLIMDNVQLTAPTAAVPEPGTWAMMGVGVAGLGVVMLRRRRAIRLA